MAVATEGRLDSRDNWEISVSSPTNLEADHTKNINMYSRCTLNLFWFGLVLVAWVCLWSCV